MYTATTLTAVTALALGCAATSLNLETPQTQDHYVQAMQKLGLKTPGNQWTHFRDGASNCTKACSALSCMFPGETYNSSSSEYAKQTKHYWSSIQTETLPACYVVPATASDVAGILLTSTFYQCPFAVKSGGHAPFAGSSNIEGGITINLSSLDTIEVSEDQKTTRVGAGNTWGNVYTTLEPKNLTVVGARVSGVGVGGYSLGGGISFFTPRYGFACDNIVNYEVVLPGGNIVNVNYTSYPDLYFALRGGGNNFGIVTHFDLDTYEQGQIWGGTKTFSLDHKDKLFNALEKYTNKAADSPDIAVSLALLILEKEFSYSGAFLDAKPTKTYPPILKDFEKINGTDNTAVTEQSTVTEGANDANPTGLRETGNTVTLAFDKELLAHSADLFHKEIKPLSDVEGLYAAISWLPISPTALANFNRRGGNALGVSDDAPIVVMDIDSRWANKADDDRVIGTINRVLRQTAAAARRRGSFNRYIFQNHAWKAQKIFHSYGPENYAKLLNISQKYDPDQVFQKLEPGYFKLKN